MRIDGRLQPINFSKSNFQGKTSQKTFSDFICDDLSRPQIPLNVSRAYASPQINPEYKVLDTFKLPNTGVGKLYQLRNGHRVAIIPKKGPTVINTYVGAGWENEKPDKRETAHLLEHLLDTKEYKTNAKELQDTHDDIIIDSNAGTSQYYTSYHEKALINDNNELDRFLEYHFSIIKSPDFSEESFQHEKTTITNELYQRNDEKALSADYTRIGIKNLLNINDDSMLYPTNEAKYIDNINKNDLYEFYNKYYRPDNMTTTIVGNVDDNTIKTFSKYFNQIKNPILKTNNSSTENYLKNSIQRQIRADVINIDPDYDKYIVSLNFLANNLKDKDNTLLMLANEYVSQKLKLENFGNSIFLDKITGNNQTDKIISIESKLHSDNIEESLKDIYKTIHNLSKEPISNEDLTELKNRFKSLYNFELAELISEFGSRNLYDTVIVNPVLLKNDIENITSDDIQQSIDKYYNLNKVSLTVVHPQSKHQLPKNGMVKSLELQPTKLKNISFKSIERFCLPEMFDLKEYILPNNIKLTINESDNVSKSAVSFSVNSKKMLQHHSLAKSYLNNVMMGVSGVKFYCNQNGIFTHLKVEPQMLKYEFWGAPEKIIDMLVCGVTSISEPVLNDENDFNYWKKINQNFFNNEKQVYKKLTQELYNETSCVKKNDDINTLTLDEVKKFHKDLLDNAQVSVNITIPKDKTGQYKQAIFNQLSQLPKFQQFSYVDYFNKVKEKPLEKSKVFVDVTNDNMISIAKKYKIIKTGNIKDFVGLNILHNILGHSDDGLLYKKLRSEQNIVYSANSKFDENSYAQNLGFLNLYTIVSPNNFKNAMHNIDECVNKLKTELVDDKTLKIAKKTFKSFFIPESSYGLNSILDICNNSFYGTQFVTDLEKAIDSITPHDIRELAKYYLSQPALYLISGNKEAIEANKEYLKTLGEIVE